jgi:NAD(P)-dependent dehydrogenase (short-subunit alcohol dehydrogenase family)
MPSINTIRARSASPRGGQRAKTDERKVILLVGATGKLGGIIAKHLASTHGRSIRLIVGGRSAERGKSEARRLGAEFIKVDIATQGSRTISEIVMKTGADIVVNAVGPFHSQDPTLLEAAVLAGCHYLDVCDDIHGFARRAKAFHDQAKASGSVCVTTAGVFPGLSNLVAAELIQEGGGADTVRLDYWMAGSCGFGAGVMISSMNGSITPSVVFRNGKPEERMPFTGRRIVDFGPIVGHAPVYHFMLPECFSLQETFAIPNVRAMFGIAPEFFNQVMFLTGFLLRLLPRSWDAWFAEYALWTVKPFDWLLGKTFAMRIAVVGKDKMLRVHRQTHADGFEATGDTVARQIMALLEYDCEPGVWFPEESIKGAARRAIIDHSVKESTHSDTTITSIRQGVFAEDDNDLTLADEPFFSWALRRAVLAIPICVVLVVAWGWPLAHTLLLVMCVSFYVDL